MPMRIEHSRHRVKEARERHGVSRKCRKNSRISLFGMWNYCGKREITDSFMQMCCIVNVLAY